MLRHLMFGNSHIGTDPVKHGSRDIFTTEFYRFIFALISTTRAAQAAGSHHRDCAAASSVVPRSTWLRMMLITTVPLGAGLDDKGKGNEKVWKHGS